MFRTLSPGGLGRVAWVFFELAIYGPIAFGLLNAALAQAGAISFSTALNGVLFPTIVVQWCLIFLERDGLKALSTPNADPGSLWNKPAFFYGMISRLGPAWAVSLLAFFAIDSTGLIAYVQAPPAGTDLFNALIMLFLGYLVVRETFHGRMRLQEAVFTATNLRGHRIRLVLSTRSRDEQNSPSEYAVLDGIGSTMTVTRSDGYRGEISWSEISRLAVREE